MAERPGHAPAATQRHRAPVVLLAVMVVLAACTVEPGTMPGRQEPLALPDAPAPTPEFGLLSGPGVSDAPCPARTNPDNGCIYLGALVDTSGPFAPLGRSALEGTQAFWQHVNEQGGVTFTRHDGLEARFDVDVERHVADQGSDIERHLRGFERIEPEVLALALSMGTPTTSEAMATYKATDTVAVPLSWWSGWAFESRVAESAASYCLQAVNGLDWALEELGGTSIDRLVVIHAPDRYGREVLSATERWVDPSGPGSDHPRVPFEPSEHAVVVEPGGDVGAAVELVHEVDPEVVMLATGPEELATIATEASELGWQGLLVGMAPTFEPSLLEDDDLADVLESQFVRVGNLGPLSSSGKAYVDMRRSLGLDVHEVDAGNDRLPANDAWIAGWVSQYPLHLALQEAIAAGDLTRAGVGDAMEGLTVHYDGALPATDYADAPDDAATRRTFVFRPDRDGLLGQRLVGDGYLGATARRVDLSRPCTDR